MSDSMQPYGQQPTMLLSIGSSRQEYWSGLPFPSPLGVEGACKKGIETSRTDSKKEEREKKIATGKQQSVICHN